MLDSAESGTAQAGAIRSDVQVHHEERQVVFPWKECERPRCRRRARSCRRKSYRSRAPAGQCLGLVMRCLTAAGHDRYRQSMDGRARKPCSVRRTLHRRGSFTRCESCAVAAACRVRFRAPARSSRHAPFERQAAQQSSQSSRCPMLNYASPAYLAMPRCTGPRHSWTTSTTTS